MAFNHRNARMADFYLTVVTVQITLELLLTVPPYEKSSVSIIESAFMKELRKESIKRILITVGRMT
jgi:hypothetical protein